MSVRGRAQHLLRRESPTRRLSTRRRAHPSNGPGQCAGGAPPPGRDGDRAEVVSSESWMPEFGGSGSMSGHGKRSVTAWPNPTTIKSRSPRAGRTVSGRRSRRGSLRTEPIVRGRAQHPLRRESPTRRLSTRRRAHPSNGPGQCAGGAPPPGRDGDRAEVVNSESWMPEFGGGGCVGGGGGG